MVAYTGIETVSNMAEEARDYGKTIPRGIGLVVRRRGRDLRVPARDRAVGDAGRERRDRSSRCPRRRAATPTTRCSASSRTWTWARCRAPAEIYVGILAATILFIATNAGLIGVSRLTYSMGQHRQLPELLRVLHPKFRTPYVAIILFGAVACVAIVPGQADFLGVIYAFGAMLSFTMAHVSLIKLRVQPSRRRAPVAQPRDAPRRRAHELPVLAVFGGLGTGIALIVATVLDLRVLVSGLLWLALGIAIYVVYRRRQGLSLTETHKIVMPKPAVEHEVEYESVLVAFEDGNFSPEAVVDGGAAGGAAPARHPRAGDDHGAAELADRRAAARAGGARGVADRLRARARRPARDRALGEGAPRPGAGRRIVEEAREIRARALVMSLPPAAHRDVAVRQDARDRAERAPLPGDHRLVARGERAPRREA